MALAILGIWALTNGWLVFHPAVEPFAAWIPEESYTSGGLGGWSSVPLISLAAGFAGALAIVSVSALIAGSLASQSWLVQPLRWLGARSIVVYLGLLPANGDRPHNALKARHHHRYRHNFAAYGGERVIGPVILYGLIQWSGYGQFLFQRPPWAHIDRAFAPKEALASA